jgi:hypothetical protein
MAAPRKYSDAQRTAMFALYRQGYTPAEITRRCKAGLVSVEPFSIPRRTVQSIVVAMAGEIGDTHARPDADVSLEERLNDMTARLIRLVEREIRRNERAQDLGRRVDKQTATELTRCIRTLAPLARKTDERMGVAVRTSGSNTDGRCGAEESFLDRLARQLEDEVPDVTTNPEGHLNTR